MRIQTCGRDKVSVKTVPGDPIRGYDHDDNGGDDQGSEPEDADSNGGVLAPKFSEKYVCHHYSSKYQLVNQL